MIIELTNYFNWKGSQISPGQVLNDLPDGLAHALITAGNAKMWTPSKPVTEEVKNEQTIQTDESENLPARETLLAGRISAITENARAKAVAEVGQIGRGTGRTANKPATGNSGTARSGKPAGTNAGKAKAKAK